MGYPDHPTRSKVEQLEHDQIITDLATKLMEHGATVMVNPGESNDNPINYENKEYYPDLYTISNGNVNWVFEVETEGTVAPGAVSQWHKYAKLGKLCLVAPKDKATVLRQLLKSNDIQVRKVLYY